jgi:hypothetical protein
MVPLERGPDTHLAAKSGMPTMTNPKQNVPLSVPVPASTAATNGTSAAGVNDVTIAPVANGTSALDTKPDARTTLATDPTAPAAKDPNAPAAPAADAAPAKTDQTSTTDTSKSTMKNKKKTTKTDQTTATTKTTASQE